MLDRPTSIKTKIWNIKRAKRQQNTTTKGGVTKRINQNKKIKGERGKLKKITNKIAYNMMVVQNGENHLLIQAL